MVFLRKEVAVWLVADPGSAGMPYCPSSRPRNVIIYHTLIRCGDAEVTVKTKRHQ